MYIDDTYTFTFLSGQSGPTTRTRTYLHTNIRTYMIHTTCRFLGGQIGPTTRTACVATDVDDASLRTTNFDELYVAYRELVNGLVDGGVDVIMIDCAFDSLNVKCAIYALMHAFAEKGVKLPVFVSMSLVDDSGRTLSGQSVEAFYTTVRHVRPFSVGFNCGAGESHG